MSHKWLVIEIHWKCCKRELQTSIVFFNLENIHYFPSCSGGTISLLHSFTPSLLHSFTLSLLHSFTPSLLHSFTPSSHEKYALNKRIAFHVKIVCFGLWKMGNLKKSTHLKSQRLKGIIMKKKLIFHSLSLTQTVLFYSFKPRN